MTEILDSIDAIAPRYDAILCDLWGCYHNGVAPYKQAMAALIRYRRGGGRVALVSNAPRPSAQVRAHLARMDADPESFDILVTSGDATRAALAGPDFPKRVEYVGPDRDRVMLEGTGAQEVPRAQAEGVLVTGLVDDETETPEDYAADLAAWRARDLPMLSANPDITVHRGETLLWCGGALAQAYRKLGGTVIETGKPHKAIYDLVFESLRELGVQGRNALMIGDGILTDIPGGARAGLDSVFVTGGLAAQEVSDDPEHPDPQRLSAYLARHDAQPRYAIGRLR